MGLELRGQMHAYAAHYARQMWPGTAKKMGMGERHLVVHYRVGDVAVGPVLAPGSLVAAIKVSPLYLPYTFPVSPYISPMSPLSLPVPPCISPTSRDQGALAGAAGGRDPERRCQARHRVRRGDGGVPRAHQGHPNPSINPAPYPYP